jgi:hypothetical protein
MAVFVCVIKKYVYFWTGTNYIIFDIYLQYNNPICAPFIIILYPTIACYNYFEENYF